MRARLLEGLGANVAIGISYRVQSGFEAQLKIQGISRIQSIRIIVYRLSDYQKQHSYAEISDIFKYNCILHLVHFKYVSIILY